jgi:hypothetical protein
MQKISFKFWCRTVNNFGISLKFNKATINFAIQAQETQITAVA